MRRRLAALAAALPLFLAGSSASAAPSPTDPIGDILVSILSGAPIGTPDFIVKATLYHAGAKGVGALDSLGCQVVAMRTVAVDATRIPRRTVLFIKETVGLPLPNGGVHDGYWYASDTGGAIKGDKIDLYTGRGATSMTPMRSLNLTQLSVSKVGEFKGCPPGR